MVPSPSNDHEPRQHVQRHCERHSRRTLFTVKNPSSPAWASALALLSQAAQVAGLIPAGPAGGLTLGCAAAAILGKDAISRR
ncbi:hypothetical protein ACWCQW_48040 [Streptomyces mirabilis]